MSGCDISGALSLSEAQAHLTEALNTAVAVETLPLAEAQGRVLAEPVTAGLPLPGFDNAAMDGYAVRLTDLLTTDTLALAGKAFAGAPFIGDWPAGSCVRIMTGAPVPEGAEAVVMQEEVQILADGRLRFMPAAIRPGQHIRRQGEDVAAGSVVLAAGLRLGAQQLPLLSALNVAQVRVYRPLKVAFFSSGDELRSLGEPLGPGQIVDSNRYAIACLLANLGCEVLDLGIIPDDPTALRAAFLQADRQADALITSGGVSVGEADYTKDLLSELGEVAFWKVAIKPGKPFAFGRLTRATRGIPFFGLPGNPVSALVTFLLLVRPALACLMGWQLPPPRWLPALTTSPLRLTPGRQDFQRGCLFVDEDGALRVASAGGQGSAMLMSLAAADCLVRLDPPLAGASRELPAGSRVWVWPFAEAGL